MPAAILMVLRFAWPYLLIFAVGIYIESRWHDLTDARRQLLAVTEDRDRQKAAKEVALAQQRRLGVVVDLNGAELARKDAALQAALGRLRAMKPALDGPAAPTLRSIEGRR